MSEKLHLPAREFDFDRDHICLDFANTVSGRTSGALRESLEDYDYLLAWGVQADILSQELALHLQEQARQQPEDAEKTIQDARMFREAFYALIVAHYQQRTYDPADLAIFNRILAESLCYSHIVVQEGRLLPGWDEQELVPGRALWEVVRQGAELLTTDEVDMVRVCAGEDCGWVFLDTSKNRSRRWCSMKSCGNRAKARRHQAKQKQTTRSH